MVRVWDAASGHETIAIGLSSKTNPNAAGAACVAFSPDGRRIAAHGIYAAPQVWYVATGSEVVKLKREADSAMSLAFSSDGKRLATAAGIGMGRSRFGMPVRWPRSHRVDSCWVKSASVTS
jgi:WD40 repeat protein